MLRELGFGKQWGECEIEQDRKKIESCGVRLQKHEIGMFGKPRTGQGIVSGFEFWSY